MLSKCKKAVTDFPPTKETVVTSCSQVRSTNDHANKQGRTEKKKKKPPVLVIEEREELGQQRKTQWGKAIEKKGGERSQEAV